MQIHSVVVKRSSLGHLEDYPLVVASEGDPLEALFLTRRQQASLAR